MAKKNEGLFGFSEPRRELVSVRHRVVDRASRYALASLLRPFAVESSVEDDDEAERVLRAHQEVSGHWRRRVLLLRSQGWSRVAGDVVGYAQNCPETGVWIDRGSLKPCGLRTICPWCWCRYYVHETFWRLKYALWRTVEEPRTPAFQFDIYDCVTTEYWKRATSVPTLYTRVADLRATTIRQEIPHNAGAFQLFTVEPPDTRSKYPEWKIIQRILVLVGVGDPAPPDNPTAVRTSKCRRVHRTVRLTAARDAAGLTQTQLAAPLGRVCQYPRQLLFGPRDLTVELLEFKGKYRKTGAQGKRKSATGFRMSGYYGCLRNASQRKRELKMWLPEKTSVMEE